MAGCCFVVEIGYHDSLPLMILSLVSSTPTPGLLNCELVSALFLSKHLFFWSLFSLMVSSIKFYVDLT